MAQLYCTFINVGWFIFTFRSHHAFKIVLSTKKCIIFHNWSSFLSVDGVLEVLEELYKKVFKLKTLVEDLFVRQLFIR